MIPTNPNNIIVTKHAQRRFLERFRLYFSKVKISSKSMWDNVMVAHIMKGSICHKWLQVPFYVNKTSIKYGPTIVIKRQPCYYICRITDDNKLKILTVVDRWYND